MTSWSLKDKQELARNNAGKKGLQVESHICEDTVLKGAQEAVGAGVHGPELREQTSPNFIDSGVLGDGDGHGSQDNG